MPPRRRPRKPPRSGALSDLPPLKIIRSIILLQLCYYTTLSVLLVFTVLVLGQPVSVDLVFDWRSVRGDTTLGWTVGGVVVLNGVITIIPLALLLPRSRQIPDFALTIHFLHLLITTIYTSYTIPTNLLWWGLEAASAGIMISLGVWASRYREMRPISFGLPTTNKKTTAGTEANGEAGVPLMQGASGSGGGGSGNNNSHDQSYEMHNIRGDENV